MSSTAEFNKSDDFKNLNRPQTADESRELENAIQEESVTLAESVDRLASNLALAGLVYMGFGVVSPMMASSVILPTAGQTRSLLLPAVSSGIWELTVIIL